MSGREIGDVNTPSVLWAGAGVLLMIIAIVVDAFDSSLLTWVTIHYAFPISVFLVLVTMRRTFSGGWPLVVLLAIVGAVTWS